MLIVEDDILTENFLSRLFRKDFEVTTVESVDEFYEKHSNSDFDIIIMDIALRGSKNGLDLTRELKATPRFSKTPILCLTAHAFLKNKTMALKSGVDCYLTKPVQNKVLRDAVKKLLKAKK